MSIRRGGEYGSTEPLPGDRPIAHSDLELHSFVSAAFADGTPPEHPVFGLVGGDLCRTLGGLGDGARLRGPDAITVPIDLVNVHLDHGSHVMVAHLITSRRPTRPFGPHWCAVMNAQYFDGLDLGPRSHPGDGLVDITVGTVPFAQRRAARRRARSGTHLPHPDLVALRSDHWSIDFDRPVPVMIDGVDRGRSRSISVDVVPDALRVVV